MDRDSAMIRRRLETPRSAAVAGILFSLLLIGSQLTIWFSIPVNPFASPLELARHGRAIVLALNLLPFAGVAFLWFLAVVRDRLGQFEDRFFSTVLLGSGLLYVAMMFMSAALGGALVTELLRSPESLTQSETYFLTREMIFRVMSIFSTKMAAVFMFTSSTIFWRTRVLPRPLAYLGYGVGILLLASIGMVRWIAVIFPLWVLTISSYILVEHRDTEILQEQPQGVVQAR